MCGSESLTYSHFYNEIVTLGNVLPQNEMTNVGLYLPNGISYLKALFAVWYIGKIPVLLNVFETTEQISTAIDFTDQYMVITDNMYFENIKNMLLKGCRNLCLYNIDDGRCEIINSDFALLPVKEHLDPEYVAVILQTSGTTSDPKYVVLTHEAVITNIRAHLASIPLSKKDTTLIVLPLCFGYCFSSQTLAHIYMGASIVFLSSAFSPETLVKDIETYNITNTTVVPSMLVVLERFLLKHENCITSLRCLIFGGFKPNIHLIKRLNSQLKNTTLVQTYGLTEHSPRITTRIYQNEDTYTEDVGKPLSGVSIQIRNSGEQMSINSSDGEIWVKSSSVMWGYYANPDATKSAIKEGWLDSGDIGHIDKIGKLYITGRKKNIIICNGINISPEVIESCIMQIEGIRSVRVSGIYHPVFGETPVAFVTSEPLLDTKKAVENIYMFCREKLPSYMVPTKIHFVENLATTITGKVKREKEQ
jgi:long-chain acyl-CoA synthetase